MNKDWYFAFDASPSETYSDGEAEIFRTAGNGPEKFKGLAREIIQNSIDAKKEDISDPLVVKFEFTNIYTRDIPGLDKLKEHVKGTVDYCEAKKKKNVALSISKKQLLTLNEESISVLKISDYNTKGVTGSHNLDEDNNKWKGLVYNEGDNIKDSESSLGSFGLGKNAAFAMSNLRTVFYVTRDLSNNYAMEGVAKLYTSFTNGQKYVPKGYFCNEYNGETRPLYEDEINSFAKLFERTKTGTDIIILDPDVSLYKEKVEWYLIESIISNFFIAIKEGLLEVYVNDKVIKQDSLDKLVLKLLDFYEDNDLQKSELLIGVIQYLETLDKGEDFSEDLIGYGNIFLKLYKTKDTKGKKVAIFREHGMLIKEFSVNGAGQKFSGVLVVKGKEGIDFLKAIEDPSHTNFDPTRQTSDLSLTQDEKEAKLKQFYNWITNVVKKFTKIKTDGHISLSGMEDYIQMPDDDASMHNIGNVNVGKLNTNKKPKKKPRVEKKALVKEVENGQPATDVPNDGVRKKHSNPNPNPRAEIEVAQGEDGDKKGRVIDYTASYEIAPLFKYDGNKAIIIYKTTEKEKDFFVKISAIDEEGKLNNVMPKINKVYYLETNEELKFKGYTIYNVRKDGLVKIVVEFEDKLMSKTKAVVYWEEKVMEVKA